MPNQIEGKTPWDYVHEGDVRNFGESVRDKEQIRKWARAFLLAGQLPYMWNLAADFKKLMYDYLELKKGDRVFIFGERLDACGFEDEVRKRIGSEGEVQAFDFTDQARALIHFPYEFSKPFKKESFDAVFGPQSINNCSNWPEYARDLVRILKKGKMLVLAEITLGGPTFQNAVNSDLHIKAWIEKLTIDLPDIPEGKLYIGPEDLTRAFQGLLEPKVFTWRDALLFYGRKQA